MSLVELLRAAADGDQRAWCEVMRQLKPRVERFLWSLGASRDDAADLAQETFIVVFKELDHFELRSEDEFVSGLLKLARFALLMARRQRRRRVRREQAFARGQAERTPTETLSERQDRAERLNLIEREAQKLTRPQCEAVVSVLQGRKAKNRSAKSRAVKKLRERLRSTPPPS